MFCLAWFGVSLLVSGLDGNPNTHGPRVRSGSKGHGKHPIGHRHAGKSHTRAVSTWRTAIPNSSPLTPTALSCTQFIAAPMARICSTRSTATPPATTSFSPTTWSIAAWRTQWPPPGTACSMMGPWRAYASRPRHNGCTRLRSTTVRSALPSDTNLRSEATASMVGSATLNLCAHWAKYCLSPGTHLTSISTPPCSRRWSPEPRGS